MKIKKTALLTTAIFSVLLFIFLPQPNLQAQEKLEVNFFWGQGCPHCEKAKDFLAKMQEKYPEIVINSYEVYTHPENQKLLQTFSQKYGVEISGVPMIFIGANVHSGYTNDATSGQKIETCIQDCLKNWKGASGEQFKAASEEIAKNLPENAVAIAGTQKQKTPLTFTKIITLALVDSINPCVLAILSLMLILVLTYNPQKKIKVLWAGLAFNLAVFLTYIFYGLVIIKIFQLIQALSLIRFWLYKGLALGTIVLGILAIRDFIKSRNQCKVNPRLNKIIAKITSPKGAFLVGLCVTIFLLPCTIGPYIVAGGILSSLELIKTLPWLILYNLIFILPTLVIAIIIYIGIARVQDVNLWEAKYMKYLHLGDGILMVALGLLMFSGII